ncbi:MAG: hypothetical protein DDT29_01488 [Dehalococcoidia bacterium]|nr:hypothetical protein [Bacillota bacterium]
MITVRNLAKACIGLALALLLVSASPAGAEQTEEGYGTAHSVAQILIRAPQSSRRMTADLS